MHLRQPAQHLADNALQMSVRQGRIFGQQMAEGLTVYILQHQIGRAVGLKKAVHLVQMRVVKASQGARLVQKPLQPPVIVRGIGSGVGHHGAPRETCGKVARQVFLERHTFSQIGVIGQIGDAKAALAEHVVNLVFFQARPRAQGIDVFHAPLLLVGVASAGHEQHL